MAYTLQQLQELQNAKAEGVLRVKFVDGQEMVFRSLDEMNRIQAEMEKELYPETSRIRRTIFTYQGY
jgi:hypothetical protein